MFSNALNQTLKLGRAYETLKDESKRRAYDLIYLSITQCCPSAQTTQKSWPPPASTSQSGFLSEVAQIAALQKSKQERSARWWTNKNVLDSSIFELQRDIRRLEQEIKFLDSIVAAEAAEDAQKNSWGTWLLSPIYKNAEDSEEVKTRKDRGRQERKIEKDLKERRLGSKKTDLRKEEILLRDTKEELDARNLADERQIQVIHDRVWARETREKEEKMRVEIERLVRIQKQQQEQRKKQEREAAEVLRKRQAEERVAEQKREEERERKWRKFIADETVNDREQYAHFDFPECVSTAEGRTRQAVTSTCSHEGWWPKVQGRTACPDCYDTWTYLLQCPSCEMKACPKCQAAMRVKRSRTRKAARRN